MVTIVEADFKADLRDSMLTLLKDRGFQYSGKQDLLDVAYAFLNTHLKRIPIAPRTVVRSSRLRLRQDISPAIAAGLDRLERDSVAGNDLKPYHSFQILKAAKADHLLYDWDIRHLHLGTGDPATAPPGFLPRSNDLVFVYVTTKQLVFIDVGTHESFADDDLLEVVLETWPETLEKFRIRALLHRGPPETRAERDERRRSGITSYIPLSNGSLYAPMGGGVASNGWSLRVIQKADDLIRLAGKNEADFRTHADRIRDRLREATGIDLPVLRPKISIDDSDNAFGLVTTIPGVPALPDGRPLNVFQPAA